MGEELKAALVEFGDGGIVFGGIPEKFALGGRVVAVRLEHGGGVRFDDAVDHEFHGVGVDPGVVIFLARAFDGFEVLRAHFRRVHEIGDVEAQGQIAVAAQFVVELQLGKIAACAVNAGEAILIGPLDAVAKSGEFFGARGLQERLCRRDRARLP